MWCIELEIWLVEQRLPPNATATNWTGGNAIFKAPTTRLGFFFSGLYLHNKRKHQISTAKLFLDVVFVSYIRIDLNYRASIIKHWASFLKPTTTLNKVITRCLVADLLSIGPLGTNFREIWIVILTVSLKKMWLKMSSAKWWQFCHGEYELSGLHGGPNHQSFDCLFNSLCRPTSQIISKLRITGHLCRSPPVTSGFPSQIVSNGEWFSIPWRQQYSSCNRWMVTVTITTTSTQHIN